MPVTSMKKIKPKIYIPPIYSPAYKLAIERKDGTVDDISGFATYISVKDEATGGVGSFEFKVYDPDEVFVTAWTGNEIVRYYKDYAAEATTLRFRGRIEIPSKRGFQLNCKGRSESAKLFDIKITKSYNAVETSVILKDLVDSYATFLTYSNVSASSVQLTVGWYDKPFWECVQELCRAAGFECFVDADLDVNYFESGSRINSDELVTHEFNLLELEDFAPDLSQIRNKIKVYGATIKGSQVMHTAIQKSGDYGTEAFGVREETVNDSISTYEQAKDYGDYLLAEKMVPPIVGSAKALLLATLKPGDSIWMSSPSDGIQPTYYIVSCYEDVINAETGSLTTNMFINKKPRTVSNILKNRIEAENKTKDTSSNPEGLDYSFNLLFEADEGSHENTEITAGVLKLQSGSSTGSWVSGSRNLSSNLNDCYLVLTGQTLTGATVYVSADNGLTYQVVGNRQKVVAMVAGTSLKVKISISDASTQIESATIQYSIT